MPSNQMFVDVSWSEAGGGVTDSTEIWLTPGWFVGHCCPITPDTAPSSHPTDNTHRKYKGETFVLTCHKPTFYSCFDWFMPVFTASNKCFKHQYFQGSLMDEYLALCKYNWLRTDMWHHVVETMTSVTHTPAHQLTICNSLLTHQTLLAISKAAVAVS